MSSENFEELDFTKSNEAIPQPILSEERIEAEDAINRKLDALRFVNTPLDINELTAKVKELTELIASSHSISELRADKIQKASEAINARIVLLERDNMAHEKDPEGKSVGLKNDLLEIQDSIKDLLPKPTSH